MSPETDVIKDHVAMDLNANLDRKSFYSSVKAPRSKENVDVLGSIF